MFQVRKMGAALRKQQVLPPEQGDGPHLEPTAAQSSSAVASSSATTTSREQPSLGKYNINNLSEEMIAEFDQAFRLFDVDGSGGVTLDELRAVFESLGQQQSDDNLKAMLDEVDNDGSGQIDFVGDCLAYEPLIASLRAPLLNPANLPSTAWSFAHQLHVPQPF